MDRAVLGPVLAEVGNGVTSPLFKRCAALSIVSLVALGPVLLFVGGAQASYKLTPYQTSRKDAGAPNSTMVKKNSDGVIIAYGNSSITYRAPSSALVTLGDALFEQNCASCHGIEGDGDALAMSTFSPSLRKIPSIEVAEAIRTGPGNMPRFTGNLSDVQVNDIVKFVTTEIQHPNNPGGFGLGGLGPVAEGFVGLAFGVGVLALVGFWVGERDD